MSNKYRKDSKSGDRVPKTVFVDRTNWGKVKKKKGNMSAWVDEKVAEEANDAEG